MFRSQQMTYYQLVMPRESAWIIINELGYLNRIQLVDHNPEQPIISRPFANYIKRCDDLLNKLSQILKEAEKVGQLKNYRKGDSALFVQQVQKCYIKTIKHHHTQLDKIEDEIQIRVNKIQENQRNYEQLLEQSMYSKEYRTILEIFQKFCGDQLLEKRSEFSKFDYFVGVISSREIQLFERLLFRITKGNAMVHFNIIQNEDIKQPSRAVYIFMYPNSGPYMRNKLQRLCDSQSKSKFVIPTTQIEFNSKMQELNLKTTEIDHLLSLTYSQLCQQINELIISPNQISLFEQYRFFLLKEKELYNNLNKLKMQGHLFTGDLWVPQQDVQILENTLNNLKNTDIPGVQIVQKPFPINEKVPTLFKINDFTKPYQLIVDTYGVPRYQEINPALFSCVTFPFLFGVMFGDIGHGGFLFCFGIYLCMFRKSIPFFDEYRYLLLLMGFFAFYSGWIYNDYVGLTIDMGSCYSQNGVKLTKKLNDCQYNFGIDPAWAETISFGDSVKMKFSVIVAYFHMSLGIILSGLNYLYRNEKVAFFCKFIPQILFITCTFGYMDFLIVYKWLNVYTDATAPSIINTMIDMFLQLGQVTELAMFNIYTQEFIQILLLIIALVCIPWMWLPETLYKMYELNHKHSNIDYNQLEDDHSIELQNVELQHSHRLSQQMNIDEENTNNISPTTSQIGFLDHQPQELHQSTSDIFVQETIETIEFVLGAISNTASYLRLWALSLAHSQLAEVFFDLILAGPIENSLYIKPIIYFPIWAMISFGVLMCMDSLECFLHSLRLHWYDFSIQIQQLKGSSFKTNFTKVMEQNLRHFHLYKNYLKFEIKSIKQNYQFTQELKFSKELYSQKQFFFVIKMENIETCSICHEEFKEPCHLPCSHIFCRDCITESLEVLISEIIFFFKNIQSCPICRRVCCNLLNKKFPAVGETNLVEHDHQGLPCFQYRIAIPHNSQAAFNFFEKRYVAMTTEALQKDLHFIIDPQVEGYCFKVKLLECQSIQDQQVYVCNVQNVGRYKIIQTSYREIPDSQDKLKYAQIEPVEDLFEDGCQEVFKSIEKCVDDLIEVLKENEYDTKVLEKLFPKNQELTQKYITNKSLELLAVVRIQEQAQIKLYFSSDVLGRLKTLFKHFDSFLTFYKDQPKQE